MSDTIEQPSVTSSLSKGINFYFEDGDNKIRVFCSMVSGKEIVYLNDKEVSNKRSLRTKTIHKFTKNKIKYEVEVEMTKILLGHIDCTLIKDGAHLETTHYTYEKSWKSFGSSFLKIFFISFVVGFIVGYSLIKFVFNGG